MASRDDAFNPRPLSMLVIRGAIFLWRRLRRKPGDRPRAVDPGVEFVPGFLLQRRSARFDKSENAVLDRRDCQGLRPLKARSGPSLSSARLFWPRACGAGPPHPSFRRSVAGRPIRKRCATIRESRRPADAATGQRHRPFGAPPANSVSLPTGIMRRRARPAAGRGDRARGPDDG